MSEKEKPEASKNDANDPKAKFREALEKKKNKGGTNSKGGPSSSSKVGGSQNSGGAPKMFRRKSGSA